MSLNSLIRWLKPRETVFFDLLEASASNLVDASRLFRDEMQTGDPTRLPAMRTAIKDFEHKGDEITHELLNHLDRTFVTPLEREDILALAHALDDVADCMDAAAERLVLYKVQHVMPIARDMSSLLAEGTEQLLPLVRSLRTMSDKKSIYNMIQHITKIENQSDSLFHAALGELFDDPKDPIILIKWKEILGQLEDAIDKIELVAKVVGSTVMRNA